MNGRRSSARACRQPICETSGWTMPFWKRREREAPYIASAGPVVRPRGHTGALSRDEVRRRFVESLQARGVAMRHTASRFPHVIDKLAAAWDVPEKAAEVFDELMIDRRGGRQGFPPEVLSEIHEAFAFHTRHRSGPPDRL